MNTTHNDWYDYQEQLWREHSGLPATTNYRRLIDLGAFACTPKDYTAGWAGADNDLPEIDLLPGAPGYGEVWTRDGYVFIAVI